MHYQILKVTEGQEPYFIVQTKIWSWGFWRTWYGTIYNYGYATHTTCRHPDMEKAKRTLNRLKSAKVDPVREVVYEESA
jgi:hypothetical protein